MLTLNDEQRHTRSLRDLYFARTVVQFGWAGAVLAGAGGHPARAAVLLVCYPLWDVACTAYDLIAFARNRREPTAPLYVNAILGVATAVAIAWTAFGTPQRAVVAFGAWACAAGLAQGAVGLVRRKAMGGQWAMVLSGLQSALAGVTFIVGGIGGKLHVRDLGGYAIFGGAYFLVAGLLMSRRLAAPAHRETADPQATPTTVR